MTDFIYLDHNSTSPVLPEVARVVAETYQQGFANPASQHRPGQLARRTLETYRSQLIDLLGGQSRGMQSDSLVFTSGGTESDNLALFGLAAAGRRRLIEQGRLAAEQSARVLVSAIEHPAVMAAAEQLARQGYDVHRIPVDQNGVCRVDCLPELLSLPTALVSVMLANNETGAIQPVAEIAGMAAQEGALVHTDAVQAVGKIPLDFRQLGVDALSFTGHKLGGPRGIGGLLLRFGIQPDPMLFGGFQQLAVRPGTEDVALVAGLCAAVQMFVDEAEQKRDLLLAMRDRLQQGLVEMAPTAIVNSRLAERVPQTLNLAFKGINRQNLLLAADMDGLAISSGSACASGSSEPSPVLVAMGLDKPVVDSSIRISVGYSNTWEEIEDALNRFKRILDRFDHSES